METATGDHHEAPHRRVQHALRVVAALALFWGGLWSIHAAVDGWWIRGLLGVGWVMLLGVVLRRRQWIRTKDR